MKNGETKGSDIGERVDLVMYLLGPRPARYDTVLEKFNELALKDLNCTLTVNFIEYGDMATKYPLIFSSGEEFDLAYGGTWVNFANLAQKGAFMPLEDWSRRKRWPRLQSTGTSTRIRRISTPTAHTASLCGAT